MRHQHRLERPIERPANTSEVKRIRRDQILKIEWNGWVLNKGIEEREGRTDGRV